MKRISHFKTVHLTGIVGEISKTDSEKEDANFRNVGQKQLSSSSKAGTSLVFVVLNFQQKLLFHLSPSWQTPIYSAGAVIYGCAAHTQGVQPFCSQRSPLVSKKITKVLAEREGNPRP